MWFFMDKNSLLLRVKDISLAFPTSHLGVNSIRDLFLKRVDKKKKKNDYKIILNNISLNIHRGDRIGIIAENGAGKSTLCRCISGSYPVSAGEIVRYGEVRALFESSLAIYPELSGRENMEILAEIFYDHKLHNLVDLVNECIAFSELGDSIEMPVKTYSKGMQLRLTLSVLSALPTDILILDEVFDGADEFFRVKLSKRIRKLIDNSGAVIFVSHQEDQILDICNRVIVLEKGKVIFEGSPEKAFENYRESHALNNPLKSV
jgi:ABC-type polysaccharide/polyol phosphate transport system ATPase subunit